MKKLTLTLIMLFASFLVKAQDKNLTVHFELALKLSSQGADTQFEREVLKKRKKDGYHLNQQQIKDIALKTDFNRLRFPVYAASGTVLLFTQKKITQEIIIDSVTRTYFSDLNVDSIEIRNRADRPQFILHVSGVFDCSLYNLFSQNWYLSFNTWEVEKSMQPELYSAVSFIYGEQHKVFPSSAITMTAVEKKASVPGHIMLVYNNQ